MIEIVKHRKLSAFLSIVFFLSGITLTVLLSIKPMPVMYFVALFIVCSLIWGYVAFNYRIVDTILKDGTKTDYVLSIVLSAVFISEHYQKLNELINSFEIFNNKYYDIPPAYEAWMSFFLSYRLLILIPVITFATISLCIIFIYLSGRLKNSVVRFFKGLETHERIFLIAGCTILALLVFILFNLTNVFYQPYRNGEYLPYDIIFTSDTGSIVNTNCYLHPTAYENDLRQPLFGIFAMPFGLLATFISYIIPFKITYPVSMNIIQIILLLITLILLSKMLEVGKTTKIYFLLIAAATFPFMLFAFNMEQYIFAVFWTILLIYNSYIYRKTNIILSVAATGSIITSAILIPLLMALNKEFRVIIKKGLKMAIVFFSVFIGGGMAFLLYQGNMLISKYEGFMASHGFLDKFRQFTHFIVSCLMAPCSQIVTDEDTVSYQLCEVHSLNIAGIILLGFAVLSAVLFRHKYIAKISIYWITFAFVLIGLLGWGTAENGTVLYSLYFFWALLVLLILFIDRLTVKASYIKHLIWGIVFVFLLAYNIIHIVDIIDFGMKYYPVS